MSEEHGATETTAEAVVLVDEDGVEHDIETLRRLTDDSQKVLDHQLTKFGDLSTKAIQLVQVNGLIITILVAASSQVTLTDYLNLVSGGSVVLFGISTVFAALAYRTDAIDVGHGTMVIDTTLSRGLDEGEYLHWLLSDLYPELIEDATDSVNRKGHWLSIAIRAFLAGLVTLPAGILLAP